MRVLHLISSSGFFGAENMVVTLAYEQMRKGLSVYIGVFKNIYNPHLEILDLIKKYKLPVKIFNCWGRFDPRTIFEIRDFIQKNRIEIVHSHGYKSNFYALCATLFIKVKRVATCHTWYSVNARMKLYERLDKLLLRRFNKVIAVSEALKDDILNSEIANDKVSVINNGIDIKIFANAEDVNYLREEFNLNSHYKIIGTVGRLASDKGHIYLFRALKKIVNKIPEIKCLVIGDGPLRSSLELGVRSLELQDKVIFTGIRSDIQQLLSLIDIFVMPSLKEGMPVALLEAMAARRPVIATRVGAIPKMIEDGRNGLLIEPRDADAICKSVIQVLNNKEDAASIARNGFEKLKNEFSSQRMAEDYIELYKETARQ